MTRHLRRARALARRYGHMSMKQVEDGAASVRRMAKDNPELSAALLGAGAGVVAAGMGMAGAAITGAVAAVGIQKVAEKSR